MAYEPTTWKSGDVVTSVKLNKLEKGVEDASSGGGGVFVVHTAFDDTEYSYTTDKTWAEIFTALSSGTPGLLLMSEDPTNMIVSVPIIFVQKNTNQFYVDVVNALNTDGIYLRFEAESADGYCVWIDE